MLRVHYDKFRKGWFIPKGMPVVIWKDAPLIKRKTFEIVTTRDMFFKNGDIYSSSECLTAHQFNEANELWCMCVLKQVYSNV